MKVLLALVGFCAGMQAFAGGNVYHWKGTEVVKNWPKTAHVNCDCAFWTNANNWVEGSVPGQYYNAAGELTGDPEATVVFGSLDSGCMTNVNLQGFYTVSNVVFASDAPTYQIGVSLDMSQEQFRFYSKGGRVTIENGAAEQFFGGVSIASESTKYGSDWSVDPKYPLVVNNSERPLTFAKFGSLGYPGATWGAGEFAFGFGGSGDIVVSAMGSRCHTLRLMLHQQTGAKLIFNCNVGDSAADYWLRLLQSKGDNVKREVVINGNFVFGGNWGGIELMGQNSELKFSGTGTIKNVYGKKNNGTYIGTPHYIGSNAKLVIDSALAGLSDEAGFHWYSGGGTVEINGNNLAKGNIDLLSASLKATLSASSIGGVAIGGPLGLGELRIANEGRVLYTGAGETCDRPIELHNYTYGICNSGNVAASPIAVIEQGGTGPLIVNSPVSIAGENAGTLTLANSTDQSATWSKSLIDSGNAALALVKTGTGVWTLSEANTYSGSTTIRGGTLAIANASALSGTSGIVVDMAAAKLKVAAGISLPAISVTQSGSGALDIELEEGASVKIANITGDAPTWLTVDGLRVRILNDGTVQKFESKWANASDGDWNTASNWDNNIVPGSTYRATIDKAGDYTVSISNEPAEAVNSLLLKSGELSVGASLMVLDGVEVEAGAHFLMSTGSLALASAAAGDRAFHLNGGDADFTGGTINLTNYWGFTGAGTLDFSGTAKIASKTDTHIRFAADAGETLNVSFTGKSGAFAGNATGSFVLGGTAGGTTIMTITKENNFNGTSASVGMGMDIGRRAGYSELICNHNYGYISAGNSGIVVGYGEPTDYASSPTGVLTIAGNSVSAGGVGFWFNNYWGGFTIGNGLKVRDGYGNKAVGVTTIDRPRGTLAVGSAFGIGIGRGIGLLLQRDGNFSYDGSSKWRSTDPTLYQPMVIGYAGGEGGFVLSNGTAKVKNGAVYIGGCAHADLNRYLGLDKTYVDAGNKDAKGLLAVRGGTFTQSDARGVIVGADGEGRLEIGPAGSFTTTSLVISNQCAGTLAFELGADGTAGTLNAESLTIAAGAKLEIDASKATAIRHWTKLVSVPTQTGAFAAGDITIKATGEVAKKIGNATIETSRNGTAGLWLKTESLGMIMILR